MRLRSVLLSLSLLVGSTPAAAVLQRADAASAPALRFQVVISGKIHANGSVTSGEAITQAQPPEFNGCAIIKHKHTELGAYTLDIRVNSDSFYFGGWQRGALDLSIADYKPNVGVYKSPHFGGKFAFKGQMYGASVTYSTVQVRNGGRDGIYTDQHAYHLIPGTANAFTTAGTLTFQATWHCATVYNLNDKS